ncbi:MAG: TPM domain-containing protein [Spirochaetaceae bacterium]|jgi:uncharacterized protein|nr:TPM domain-containing protein [Spirochaetaceae bacterium]
MVTTSRRVPLLGAAILLFLCPALCALDPPPLKGPVNDLAYIMSTAEREELTRVLLDLDSRTDAQIGVLTIPSLEGDDIESFSIRTAEAWQLGNKGTDLGALLVVALQEREVRIEAGYGAEGTLTDAKCGLIIRNIIAPAFRSGKYGAGITEACRVIGGVLTGDAAPEELGQDETGPSGAGFLTGLFFFIEFCIILLLINPFGWRRPFFSFLFPFLFASRGRGSGRFSGGSGFGGGFGGSFGGSSFHGGGGGFGGGGASGRW